MFVPHVLVKCFALSKCGAADGTLMWLFVVVNSRMSSQMAARHERFIADVALEIAPARMDAFMFFSIAFVSEALFAEAAFEWLVEGVRSLVSVHVSLYMGSIVTNVAYLKRVAQMLLCAYSPKMFFQSCFVRPYFFPCSSTGSTWNISGDEYFCLRIFVNVQDNVSFAIAA